MQIEIFESIEKIAPQLWQGVTPREFPFASHAFLLALEQNNCLGDRTGWTPFYVCAFDGGELLGAMVLFSKTNSYGEYIFDFAWAQAYESVGLDYYPKLVAAIPFTSATGPKILLNAGLGSRREDVSRKLVEASLELTRASGASSLHALFITESEIADFESHGFFIRESYQYHWLNENYNSFADFLKKLRSKRRSEAIRERKQVAESGLKISRLTGSDLTDRHATAMYRFYKSTVQKKGGYLYLTPAFFKSVFAEMKDHILFVLAENSSGDPVAGALNFFGSDTLFGRNWGCLDEYKSLHLEICYYQGIEFAIESGLKLFEAGAQGEHKFQRGFLPRRTYSAHVIENPRLSRAIGDFINQEKREIKHIFQSYEEHSPFSRAQI